MMKMFSGYRDASSFHLRITFPLLFLFFLLFRFSTTSAYTVDQIVSFDNVQYQVLTLGSNTSTLRVLGTTSAFSGTSLTIKATLSDNDGTSFTVTEIGGLGKNYSFKGITSLALPSTLTTIGDGAFNGTTLSSLTIPASVTSFSYQAFAWANQIPAFSVEPGNTSFKNDANGSLLSADGTQLYAVPSSYANASYSVPATVTEIENGAFMFSKNIATVTIPSSVTKISTGEWPTISYKAAKLTAFEVSTDNTVYSSKEGLLLNKAANTLLQYPPAKADANFKVPDGITTLGSESFYRVPALTSIDVNQVTTLTEKCLDNNYNLKQFTIPKSLTSIPDGAIADCPISKYVVETGHTVFSSDDNGVVFNTDKTKLLLYPTGRTDATYTIPSTVKEIGGSAFFGASNLTSITIPSTVKTLGESAFAWCPKLATVTFTETASIEELPKTCFNQDVALTTITLPSSCKIIDGDAFLNCTGLTTVNVPNGSQLTTLSSQCFKGCNLTSFNFLGSCDLTTIGNEVFRGMTNLKSFVLPASVTTLGQNAFRNCSNLTSFTFASDAQITEIGSGALADCGITDITLPSSLQKINSESFARCQGLKKATLPTNLDWISPEAFNGCYKLTDIEIDSQNKNYSTAQGVLYDKEKNVLVLYPSGSTANPVFIAPSVTKIGDYAFYDCPYITHIIIPKKVKAFGERAFGLDTKLERLTLLCDAIIKPSNIDQTTNGMSFDDGTQTGGRDMFANITLCVRKSLKAQYADSAFYKKFKAIETTFTAKHNRDSYEDGDEYLALSDSEAALVSTKADVYTYVVSKTVTSADDSKTRTVTQIGDYAFENNYSVEEVVLPADVSYIGAMAFLSDTWESSYSNGTIYVRPGSSPKIKNVFFCGSTTPTNMATSYYDLSTYFNEFASSQNIYVKKSLENTFKTTWTGKSYADKVSYKIPGADITAKYVSFAREFDVDLSDFESTHPVYAFIAEEKEMTEGPGRLWGQYH